MVQNSGHSDARGLPGGIPFLEVKTEAEILMTCDELVCILLSLKKSLSCVGFNKMFVVQLSVSFVLFTAFCATMIFLDEAGFYGAHHGLQAKRNHRMQKAFEVCYWISPCHAFPTSMSVFRGVVLVERALGDRFG